MPLPQDRVDAAADLETMSGARSRCRNMRSLSTRLFLGSLAGALAVLLFHQTTLQAFYWAGLAPQAAFRIAQVPPFDAPVVVSITFWGAVYGAILGIVSPWARVPLWLQAAGAGFCAMALAWFVFLPLMGHAAAFGWRVGPMVRSFIAYQAWGAGFRLLSPRLHPRQIEGRQARYTRLATRGAALRCKA